MRSYIFTVLLAAAVLVLFVQPNKPNQNLNVEEIVARTEERSEIIRNVILITKSQVARSERQKVLFSEHLNTRLESFYDDVRTAPTEYFLTGYRQSSEQDQHASRQFLYRYAEPEGWYAEEPERTWEEGESEVPEPDEEEENDLRFSDWEKQEPPVEFVQYRDALDLLKALAPYYELRQTEQNYLLTAKSEHGNPFSEPGMEAARDLILRLAPTMAEALSAPPEDTEFQVRFVVNYRDMNIQNLQVSYTQKENSVRQSFLLNTVFEQFNIVPPPRAPHNAPELPV